VKTIRFLIARGASVHARDANESTPLHLAAKAGHLEAVKVLLEHKADPNTREKAQWTPLHEAVTYHASASLVEVLLQFGADPHAADRGGYTPYEAAKKSARKIDYLPIFAKFAK
jgi:ankyrin repeat protein